MKDVHVPEESYIITDDKKEAQLLAQEGYRIEILYICIKD